MRICIDRCIIEGGWLIDKVGVSYGESLVPVDLVGHDVVEVFEGDEAVVVEVCALDHGLDVLVVDVLADVLGDLFEFEAGEFTLS